MPLVAQTRGAFGKNAPLLLEVANREMPTSRMVESKQIRPQATSYGMAP